MGNKGCRCCARSEVINEVDLASACPRSDSDPHPQSFDLPQNLSSVIEEVVSSSDDVSPFIIERKISMIEMTPESSMCSADKSLKLFSEDDKKPKHTTFNVRNQTKHLSRSKKSSS